MPTVSVILTCFNQGSYVAQAVDSVLAQTFSDFELLVVDNGSTDDSARVLEGYRGDPRIQLFLFPENESLSRRFNNAIDVAAGRYVTFLYADDWLLPTKLESQVATLDTLPPSYGVAYAAAKGFNETTGAEWMHPVLGRSGDIFEDLMLKSDSARIDMSSPMTRRGCLLEHRFDETIFAETEAIYLRIALTHRFAFTDAPGVVLRDHGDNAGKAIRRNLDQLERSLGNLRAHPACDPVRTRMVERYLATTLRTCGWSGLRVGADTAWARSCLIRSVRIFPRGVVHPKIAGGLLLSLLPARVRELLNHIGHRLRGARENPTYVEEYFDAEAV